MLTYLLIRSLRAETRGPSVLHVVSSTLDTNGFCVLVISTQINADMLLPALLGERDLLLPLGESLAILVGALGEASGAGDTFDEMFRRLIALRNRAAAGVA